VEEAMEIGLPDHLQMQRLGTHIEIVRTWRSPALYFLSAFILFWDGFLVFWYSHVPRGAGLLFVLFPLLHVGVGLGLTYYVFCGWLNRTWIRVGQGQLVVRHGPLPWPGNKVLRSGDLKQLYSKENLSRSRNGTSSTYEVRAVTHSGLNIRIVAGLATSEQALYIEQQVEQHLGIENTPVPGAI
jgi:hypothetical protein